MIKKDKSYIDDNSPILYFIATPIGNLKDITLRALELLQQADIIACEDTRNTKKLLSFYQIDKPLFSLHEHNEISAANCLIEKIKQNQRIVYVSDAGYPIISDPGQILAKICLQNNIKISIIPGARRRDNPRILSERFLLFPAPRHPAAGTPGDPRFSRRADLSARLRDRIRFLRPDTAQPYAGDKSDQESILRRTDQRNDRL